jgi:hypothetical protein
VIREQRFAHPHPRVQQRLEVLWLKSKRLPHAEICRLTGLSRSSVQRYRDDDFHGGLRTVLLVRFAGTTSRRDDHRDLLREHFRAQPPRTAREAQVAIERCLGEAATTHQEARASLLTLAFQSVEQVSTLAA